MKPTNEPTTADKDLAQSKAVNFMESFKEEQPFEVRVKIGGGYCAGMLAGILHERERAAKVARNDTDHVAGKIIADKIMAGA